MCGKVPTYVDKPCLYTLLYTSDFQFFEQFFAYFSQINISLVKSLTVCSKNAILYLLFIEILRFSPYGNLESHPIPIALLTVSVRRDKTQTSKTKTV